MKVKIDKISSKFFILSNLTEWHFSCRERLNSYLFKKYGELSSEQSDALLVLGKLLDKHNYRNCYLGKYFFADTFEFTKEHFTKLSKEEFKELKGVFEAFNGWWDRVWDSESLRLHSWREKLSEFDDHEEKGKDILATFSAFYGVEVLQDLTVYLLISAPGEGSGGANVGENKVTLECGGLAIEKNFFYALGILFHEISHLYNSSFRGRIIGKNLGILDKSLSEKSADFVQKVKGVGYSNLINEGASHCLFPFGALAPKYTKVNPDFSKRKFEEHKYSLPLPAAWGHFSAYKLAPVALEYIEKGRKIDDAFVDSITQTLVEFFEHYD